MARARRTTPSVRTGRRSPTTWGGVVATGMVSVPAVTKVLLATFIPAFPTGETIRRLRGTFMVRALEVGFTFHGAIGAFIANDTAVSAGVASLLDPVTDVQDDAWLWYQSFHGAGAATGEPGSAGSNAAQVYTIDSKAMRKMEVGFTTVVVVANASGSEDFQIALSMRALGSESL